MSAGTPTITSGTPILGDSSFTVTVGGLYPGGFPLSGLILSLGSALPGIPVPGAPAGALLYVNPTIVNIGTANASGDASYPIPLPCNPLLMGQTLLAQGFDWDASLAFPLPLGFSPGMIMTLGY